MTLTDAERIELLEAVRLALRQAIAATLAELEGATP